jgi:hypothetical protein
VKGDEGEAGVVTLPSQQRLRSAPSLVSHLYSPGPSSYGHGRKETLTGTSLTGVGGAPHVTAVLRGLWHVLENLDVLSNRAKWAQSGGIGVRVREEMQEVLVNFRDGRICTGVGAADDCQSPSPFT